jgi:predicted kinase
MIAAGEDVRSHLRGVARQIVQLHEVADRGRQVTADGGWPAVRERWEQAFEQLEPFVAQGPIDAEALATVATLGRRWLAGRRELYVERSRHHQIVDGHGDLRADNIFCLDDGPRILDCIEFDDRLRHIDVADEVAFLMMDLRRLGRANEAELFRGWYEELSGSTLPTPLVEHSVAYWALVRAKVAALRTEQGDPDAAAEAWSLLTTAASQLHTFRPRLVLVGGLPASGKSTLAEGLGLATGWPVLSTDILRKQRAGLADLASARSGIDQGLYEPDAVAATYDLLRQRADALLRRGFAVILDASWTDENERRRAAALADDLAVDVVELRCAVDPETARQRLERRAGQPGASDAGPEVADALAARADPWPSAITVDTTASPSHAVDAALEAVR